MKCYAVTLYFFYIDLSNGSWACSNNAPVVLFLSERSESSRKIHTEMFYNFGKYNWDLHLNP